MGSPERHSCWSDFALAASLTAVCAAAREILDPILQDQSPFVTFSLSIAACSLLSGLRAGVIATILALTAGFFLFVELPGRFDPESAQDYAVIFLAAMVGFVLAFLGAWGRKQAVLARAGSAALSESERKYRTFVEALGQVVWTVDPSGRAMVDNPEWRAITGQTREQIRGFGWLDAVSPEDQPRVREAWRSAEKSKGIYEAEYLLKHRDGKWLNILARGVPIKNGAGDVMEYIGTCIDITARKRTEEALRLSEERLAAFMRYLPCAAWIKNFEGRYLFANAEGERIFGLSVERLRGKTDEELFPPETARQFRENDQRIIKTGDSFETTETLRQPDGQVHRSIVTKFPLRDSKNRVYAVGGVAFDITERERAREELNAARQRAEKANAAKDHFLAALSHELRTPLAPVLAAVSIMQRKGARCANEGREELEIIQRNIKLEARLIDDLLDLTRIVRGKVTLERSVLNICTVLQRVLDICRPDIQAKKLHCNLHVRHPPFPVRGDAARLQQIVWNLLKNSIKFTPEGGRIAVRSFSIGGKVVVEVKDSGRGIEPDALSRIFDAFEQGGDQITREFGGLGLGLAISKRLVELHGGSITAQSAGKDRGAKFRVILPLAEESARPETPGSVTDVRPQGASWGRRVLLVEDHFDTASMMRQLLELSGYEVKTTPDVAQSLEAANEERFDILISDLGLPDGSGFQLMEELRRRKKPLKGIALSGFGREQDIQKSKEAGFSEHLIKPVDFDALLAAVARVLYSPEIPPVRAA